MQIVIGAIKAFGRCDTFEFIGSGIFLPAAHRGEGGVRIGRERVQIQLRIKNQFATDETAGVVV
jgi:hypothetical protein